MSLMNLPMTKYRLEEQCHKGVDKRSDVTDEPVRLEEQCHIGVDKRSNVTDEPAYDKVQVRGTVSQRCG